MTTIGYATLQIIPSLQGVTEAIEKQVEGKVVNVTIEPKVDAPATERAGKQVRETVEKHTKEVTVEPKLDQKAAENVGKKTGEAVAKGTTGSSSAIGQAMIGVLEGAGGEAGRRLGERLAQSIPTGMTGSAERIGNSLRNSLPRVGEIAGAALGSGIAIGLADAIGKQRLDKAGAAIMTGLTRAVAAANKGTDIGVAIANKVATGLTSASGVVGGAAAGITNTLGGITSGIDATRQLLGGDNSWAAPGLDTLNGALGQVTPLLGAVSGAATLASAGAQAVSTAAGIATKAQVLWNAALIANPLGLIVGAIALVVTGLVLFFTKTELGQKIWQGFTEYLKIAWEAIKVAFGAAWAVISGIWDGMVTGAGAVWDGIKTAFTNVINFVKELPGKIASVAGGMWDGIGNAFKAMIDKLKGWWNGFASALSFTSPDWLPGDPVSFSLPKFAGGGYTGAMPADQAVGVVHGGEYVINASSTSGIQNAFPGLLDYLNNNGSLPMPGYAGGGLVAGTAELGKIISEKFGVSNIGGWRPADKYGEHSTGRALDVMTSSKSTGDAIKDFAVDNASAIDLKWAIWQQKLWYPGGGSKAMPDRGSPTQNHMDHVHIFSGTGISNGLRGSLAAATASGTSDETAQYDPTGVSAPDETSSMMTPTSAASNAGGSASSSISLASSFSGLAGSGLSNLGSGVGKTQSGSDLSLFSEAGGAAVSGQVSSALGVLGVGDSPGWLKGISSFVSGIKVGGGGGGGPLGGDASPVSAVTPAFSAAGTAIGGVHGGGGQAPGPQVTYNIQTTDIEPAYLASQRLEKERSAANLARY